MFQHRHIIFGKLSNCMPDIIPPHPHNGDKFVITTCPQMHLRSLWQQWLYIYCTATDSNWRVEHIYLPVRFFSVIVTEQTTYCFLFNEIAQDIGLTYCKQALYFDQKFEIKI